jgi:hypothetical protein
MAGTSVVWPLFVAIADALNADAGVAALLGGDRVYNAKAPREADFDYIVLGTVQEAELYLLNGGGSEASIMLHLWCAGDDAARCAKLYGEVHRVLNQSSLPLVGFGVRATFDLRLIGLDPDPNDPFVHGVARLDVKAIRE